MYKEIKEMADNALGVQNKDVMDNALRVISTTCAKMIDASASAGDPSVAATPATAEETSVIAAHPEMKKRGKTEGVAK